MMMMMMILALMKALCLYCLSSSELSLVGLALDLID